MRMRYSFERHIWLLILIMLCPSALLYADEGCTQAARLVREGSLKSDATLEEEQKYREASELCPKMAEAHYNLGVLLLAKRDLEGADKALRKAIELRPDPQFRTALGNLLIAKEQFDSAQAELEEVLKNAAPTTALYQSLAYVANKKGDTDQATAYLQKAQKLNPSDLTTNLNLGALFFGQKKFPEAEQAYQRVLQTDPENVDALFFLGLAERELGQPAQAAKQLEKAAALNPKDARIFQAWGSVLEQLKDYEKAELVLRRALEIAPGDSATTVNLAVVLIRKEQAGLAEELIKPLILADPQRPRAKAVLGWAQLELGKYRDAERSLQEALLVDPKDAFAQNNLGTLYERLGRREEATLAFQAARKIDPKIENNQ